MLKDWLDDFKIRLVKGKNLPRRVHNGFLGSLDALWPKIQELVGGTQKPLYVTGHSKGGGLAFLASYRLSKTVKTPKLIYTFAAPKVGDDAFAEAYDAEVPETYRVEYRDDLAPHLPASTGVWVKIFEGHQAVNDMFPAEAPHLQVPSDIAKDFEDLIGRVNAQLAMGLNYAPAGRLVFYDWQTPPQSQPDSRFLKLERELKLGANVAELRFDKIIQDHFSNGGYLVSSCVSPAPVA